jgi:hypothetical protein
LSLGIRWVKRVKRWKERSLHVSCDKLPRAISSASHIIHVEAPIMHEHYRPDSMTTTWRIHRPAAIIAEAFPWPFIIQKWWLSHYSIQLLHWKSWKRTRMWRNAFLEVHAYLWPHDARRATQGE